MSLKKNLIQSRSILKQNQSWADNVADFLTLSFGTTAFLSLNALFFLGWILINAGVVPGVRIFDPFPYGLLTMAVSLEAIFLSIIVLISQNRASRIADLREELDLKINIQAENEITKVLNILDEIHDHLGLAPEDDEELIAMKQKTNIADLEKGLENVRSN